MTLKTRAKISIGIITTALVSSLLLIKPLRADLINLCDLCQTNYFLNQISSYTYRTLEAINNVPNYMKPMALLADSMLKTDNSEATAALQSDLTNYSNALLNNYKEQLSSQSIFLDDFFTQNGANAKPTPESLPIANEITYTTVLGKPYFATQELDGNGNPVDSVLRYVENAAGQSIFHILPGTNWSGPDTAQAKYRNYYKTISAIQTFNSYVASELYVNKQNGFNLSNLQLKLMQDATNADTWFKKIASEDIGIVFRQILLFNSQVFVLLVNLLQIQKDQLLAQTMTNSLLIIGNQFTENTMAQQAQGKMRT